MKSSRASLPDFQLEARLHKTEPSKITSDESLDQRVTQFEQELITGALEQNRFNLTHAAERLKISRHSLRYRMQRLNIALPADSDEEPPLHDDNQTSHT